MSLKQDPKVFRCNRIVQCKYERKTISKDADKRSSCKGRLQRKKKKMWKIPHKFPHFVKCKEIDTNIGWDRETS